MTEQSAGMKLLEEKFTKDWDDILAGNPSLSEVITKLPELKDLAFGSYALGWPACHDFIKEHVAKNV